MKEIGGAIKETMSQQSEALKVQKVVEKMQSELRRIAYSESAQKNLTKL